MLSYLEIVTLLKRVFSILSSLKHFNTLL